MIPRYTRPEMAQIWSEENKYSKWLEVEIAVCEILAEKGQVPADALAEIKDKAAFSIKRIHEIEEVTRHDVIAFLSSVAESVGEASRYIHLGLTSTDVVDTAQALLVKDASAAIEAELLKFLSILEQQAIRYKDTPVMGRTHGVHAEPTTFGLKLVVWYSEMQRNLERFRRARENLEVGKISGPVGTFSHLPPDVEEKVCRKLEIGFARASTQTLQRDRHAEYICALAILGSTYDKIATEIRHLQRTEVGEAREAFGSGQKGSSAMPHKRNPIACENVSGLARILRSNAVTALENIPLWHERDISHSSAERVILPDSTTLAHYLTTRIANVIKNLAVDEARMQANIDLSGGLTFSSTLLVKLVEKGVLRDEAYVWVQRNSMRAWDEKADFKGLILMDEDIRTHLSAEEIEEVFDLRSTLQHVETVFERVFSPA